jgi:hypothetical protein
LVKHLKEYGFWVGEAAWLEFTRRFPRELASLGSTDDIAHVLGILILSRGRSSGHFNAVGGSLMRVTPQFIPVHSQYEALVANALVEADRAFIKPLRYDSHESDIFPDFCLLDTAVERLPMEIYGYTNHPGYERRKQEKLEWYRQSGTPFWHWDVATSGRLEGQWPPFPPKRRRSLPGPAHSVQSGGNG